ncbi:Glycosylphosphatidylinositol anchor biosynthesis protein 11 like [Verticillium longisporum]|nr:Glycosylphosphatidylinositol anchor biosynthesis protein 11 like [Verticillium longisporum]
MASAPTKPTTATAAAAALQPVLIQQTPAGQAGRYVHPVVLLALFGSQFNSLVNDPVRVLVTTLPIVAAVQVAYVSLCLPAAGSQDAKPARKARPGEKKKQDGSGPNPVIALFLSLLMTALVTPALHLAFVLFGAPFLMHIPHTLLLSTNLALLALFPLFYKWPVTILYGLYAGYVAGKVTGGFLLFGKRMVSRVERDDKEE